jgi:hypothetical protein
MIFTDVAAQQLVTDRIASLHETARRSHARRRATLLRRRFTQPASVASAVLPALAVSRARPPTPYTEQFSAWAGRLAAFVAEAGVGAVERPVGRVVQLARRHGAPPGAVAVLADRGAPSVARERALGIVLVALSAVGQPTGTQLEAGARTVA